jgi:hypothetical protein
MFIQKIRSLSFTCFLTLIGFVGTGLGNSTIHEFVPSTSPDINKPGEEAYSVSSKATHQVGYAPARSMSNISKSR